jgi:hypothetical protein
MSPDACPTWAWCDNTPHDEPVWHRRVIAEITIDDGKITVAVQQEIPIDKHPKVTVTTHYHGTSDGRHYNTIHSQSLSAFDAVFMATAIAAERSGRGYGALADAVSGEAGQLAQALVKGAQMLGLDRVLPSLRRCSSEIVSKENAR